MRTKPVLTQKVPAPTEVVSDAPEVRQLYMCYWTDSFGNNYDYTNDLYIYLSYLNGGAVAIGVTGDLFDDLSAVPDATPVYMLQALGMPNPERIRLAFSDRQLNALENEGWTYQQLMGYLIPDGSTYVNEGTLPLYSLYASGSNLERSCIVTDEATYNNMIGQGWIGEGKMGNVFFHSSSIEQNAADFFQNALFCANMSNLAYSDQQTISASLSTYGYELEQFYDSSTDTQAFLAYNASTNDIVLSFRGTWQFNDIDIDLWLELALLNPELSLEAKVPQGFLEAYISVQPQLSNDVINLIQQVGGPKSINNFFITGHSLGGALAVYAALDISLRIYKEFDNWADRNTVWMMNFGAPPVGNDGFSQLWKHLTADFVSGMLFVDSNDQVPLGSISWIIPGFPFNLIDLGYSGVDEQYMLPAGGPMPYVHTMPNYIQQIMGLIDRPVDTTVTSLQVYITTGDDGTDRDVRFTIGAKGGPIITQYLDSWGNDFEQQNVDVFEIDNPSLLTMSQLQYYKIKIDVSSGWGINYFKDNWMLAGVKIVANNQTVYDNQNINKRLGPEYNWDYTDDITN